jgi:outer membrane lipoprotein SlyB
MKRTEPGVLLAGLLAFGLAACSSSPMNGNDTASTTSASDSAYTSPSTSSNPTVVDSGATPPAATDTSSTAGSSGTGATASSSGAAQTAAPAVTTPNGRVTLIETVPRSSTAAGGTVGGTGTTASTGSPAGSDSMYRVTILLDDGTSRVITQEWAPAFRTGDRVRVQDGAIQR